MENGIPSDDKKPKTADPVVSIPLEEKSPKAQNGSAGGGHGFQVEHPTTYAETLMHLLRGNIGSGIFAMGDAVRNAGLFVAPVVLLLLGVICVHSQHLLLRAAREMTKQTGCEASPDFAETVEMVIATGPTPYRRLAPWMRKMVNVFLCVTQLGFCCVYFVFISTNIKQVMDQHDLKLDVHLHMAIILVPILLSCLVRNLKYLAPISTIANVLMLVGMCITLYYITREIQPISSRNYVAEWNQFPLFFGTAIYAFEGIGLVLPLQNEMKKPHQFAIPLGVLNLGMSFVTLLFIVVGFFSYLQYGEDIKGSVTLNLPESDVLAQSVKIIIPLGILLTYALQFYIANDIIWSSIKKSHGPFKRPVLMESIFRSFLVFITFILAEAIPYLGLFISLVGAVSSSALALIFPPILDLIMNSAVSKISVARTVKNLAIITIGVLGCITGTYESLVSIVEAFRESS